MRAVVDDVGEPPLELGDGGRRRSAFVSTMASLQYSMPVHAIVVRRNGLGGAVRPSPSRSATKSSTPAGGDVEDDELLVRR